MIVGTGIYHRQLILKKEERHILIMVLSEVAQFRQQQTSREEAALLGLRGLASGVSRHDFIEARMERGAERILWLLQEGKDEEAQYLMNTRAWGQQELEELDEEEGEFVAL